MLSSYLLDHLRNFTGDEQCVLQLEVFAAIPAVIVWIGEPKTN